MAIHRNPFLRAFLFALFFYYGALFLCAPAQDIDVPWPWFKNLGVLLLTAFLVSSLWGWGRNLSQALHAERAQLALALGTLLFSFFALLAAMLGAAGPGLAWVWLAFLLCGCALFFLHPPFSKQAILDHKWFLLFLGILTALALVPQSLPDPLYYQLLGPSRWYAEGTLKFFADMPLLFQGGLWENLYFYPFEVLARAPGQDLIAAQIMAQLLHLWLGWGGSYFLLLALLGKISVSRPELWALVLLLPASFLEFVISAKSEGGVLLWSLAALTVARSGKRGLLLAGFFLGAAFSTKWTDLFTVAPLLAWICWMARRREDRWLLPLASFLLGALPICVRNLLFTHDLFFPIFTLRLNGAFLSPTDKLLFSTFAGSWRQFGAAEFGGRLLELVTTNPLSLLSLLMPLAWGRKKLKREEVVLAVMLVLGFCAAAFFLHPALRLRLAGPVGIVLSTIGIVSLYRLGWARALPPKMGEALVLLYGIFMVWNFSPTWPGKNPALVIRSFSAGGPMAWLRMNGSGESAVFGGNAELYYMGSLPAVDPETSLLLDPALQKEITAKAMVRLLRSQGFRWFVETAGAIPRGRTAGYFALLAARYGQDAIVYSDETGRVWDLAKLAARVEKTDYVEPEHLSKGNRLQQQK